MNNILSLKGNLLSSKNTTGGGKAKFFNAEKSVSSKRIQELINETKSILSVREINREYIKNCLVLEKCIDVLPKSRRNKTLFKDEDNKIHIVGAKFLKDEKGNKVHGIVYLTTIENIQKTINDLEKLKLYIDNEYNGNFTQLDLDNVQTPECKIRLKSKIKDYLVDISNINELLVPSFDNVNDLNEHNLVNFYNTGDDIRKIFEKIGIDKSRYMVGNNAFNEFTYLLSKEDVLKIANEASYLISMAVTDISKLVDINSESIESESISIKEPTTEPTIGVIDTLFNKDVYFSKWVENHNMLDKDIPGYNDIESTFHGTMVDSIIVDGHRLNPSLDDDCGYFKVRHFGVATDKTISRYLIMGFIKQIINENKDIHVWNISLGSIFEISDNFISPEAALLDELQSENPNLVFVVCGTNDKTSNTNIPGTLKIGAPADSLNSIVVNSVDKNKNPAVFTRKGEVLSFFIKPDISYYGGDIENKIIAHNGFCLQKVAGTSFSAPFIARKMCYLMDVLGFSREVAKALLIDSASGWNINDTYKKRQLMGHGVVPIKIEDVVQCKNNEIKFFITGNANEYNTYSYNLPIPSENDGSTMYVARAVLCCFPSCSRDQGVDYTDVELDLSFGRVVKDKNDKVHLNTINKNIQNESNVSLKEEDARKLFRKRDNVKRVCEEFPSGKPKSRKSLNGKWGFSVRIKQRDSLSSKRGIPFGMVITLSEKNLRNKQDEFIKNCIANGWLVEEINIENKINLYTTAQEEVEFD